VTRDTCRRFMGRVQWGAARNIASVGAALDRAAAAPTMQAAARAMLDAARAGIGACARLVACRALAAMAGEDATHTAAVEAALDEAAASTGAWRTVIEVPPGSATNVHAWRVRARRREDLS
jgi:hypothetical protein